MPRGYFQTTDAVNSQSNFAHKPKGYQIISPGADSEYGNGGWYDPKAALSGLSEDQNGNKVLDYSPNPLEEDLDGDNIIDPYTFDYDNITNFSGGKLKP
jgi:hypothetical protein